MLLLATKFLVLYSHGEDSTVHHRSASLPLISCKECSQQISQSAKTCPHCGAKNKKPQSPIVKWGVRAFLIYLVGGIIFGILQTEHQKNQPIDPAVAENNKQYKIMLNRAALGLIMLKKNLRDPESFKLESAFVIKDTLAVCYEFRARNGFGGINLSHAVLSRDMQNFKIENLDGFIPLWNKECADKKGFEVIDDLNWKNLE